MSDLRVVVIGAGMSGILAAITLRKAGIQDVAVYEKADRLGGTWRENTYPGLTCDVPSHLYSYSFAPNPEWSLRFAPGPEIEAYFEDVARRYEVDRLIRYGTEIERCAFERGRWHLATRDGRTDEADVVIAATGVLHHPAYPDIPGLDTFEGACFHSARWDHDVPLDGRRIGVVGTGSTAIQIATALVDRVATLHLFQRTAQWIAPVANPAYTEEERAAFRRDPAAMAALRQEALQALEDGFANVLVDANSPMLLAIHAGCEANLDGSVRDPVLRERLRPSYRAACKRLIVSDGFYEAIQRPNATLVTDGIERVEPAGVRTRDGTLHELDVLVLATGFRVDRFVRPMRVIGRDGVPLDDVWAEGPFAYMALAVPELPNFFMLQGPNGPVGQLLAHRGGGAADALRDAARGRAACRALPRSEPDPRRHGALRCRAARGCPEHHLEHGLQELVPGRFRTAHGLAVDLRPLPGGDGASAPGRLRPAVIAIRTTTMAIDFSFPPEIEELRLKVRRFIAEVVRPKEAEIAQHEGDRRFLVEVDHRDARRRPRRGALAAAHAEGVRRHGVGPRRDGGGIGRGGEVRLRTVRAERPGARRRQHAHAAPLGHRRRRRRSTCGRCARAWCGRASR